MSRAGLLLTVGDPFILNLWLEYYEKIWCKEVNKIYVVLDNREDSNIPNINSYLNDLFRKYPNIEVAESGGMGIGNAITKSFQICKEDNYVLLNDDCIIFRPYALDYHFSQIEKNKFDAVGSPLRNYTPVEVDKELQTIFSYSELENEFLQRYGYAFWQNLFFGKTSDALKTDLDMDVKTFKQGEFLPQLKTSFATDTGVDVFVSFSWQLRRMGLRFDYIKQGHTTPQDVYRYIIMEEIFSGNYSWVHIGNMSTLTVYLRQGWENRQASQSETEEYQRKFAWWEIMMERYPNIEKDIPSYVKVQKEVLSKIKSNLSLKQQEVDKLKFVYRRLLGI